MGKEVETQESSLPETGLGLAEFLTTAIPEDASSTEESSETPEAPETPEETETPAAPAEVPAEAPAPEKPEGELPVAAQEPKPLPVAWEDAANPYIRRFKDASGWANETHKTNLELRRKLEIIEKKLDGTYDPALDTLEPAGPTPDDIRQQAEMSGKVRASIAIAEQQFGRDHVHKMLFDEGAPFRAFDHDQAVQARILASEAPAMEALKFIKEREFFGRYGSNPEEIVTKIKAEQREELTKQVREEVKKELEERLKKKDTNAPSLSAARGAPDTSDERQVNTQRPLSDIVNPGLAY